MNEYSTLVTSAQWRQNPERDALIERKFFSDSIGDKYDVQKYIKLAMNEVDEKYTQKTLQAGERVKIHLQREQTWATYKYQGSVMTKTHIKGYSDIDLLTICDKFYSWDSSGVNKILDSITEKQRFYQTQIDKLQYEKTLDSYKGDSLDDLRSMRLSNERVLQNTYDICDISNPKAIMITNQDLHRDVDIVTASWYDDVQSIISDKGDFRGVQIYNKDNHLKESSDFPFLSIKRINERGSSTHGRIKKMIRFLKTLKADSNQDVKLNSFEINAICYNIPTTEYDDATYLQLVIVLYLEFTKISSDSTYANQIVSVDGREYIFRGKPNRLTEFQKLNSELLKLINDLINLNLIS